MNPQDNQQQPAPSQQQPADGAQRNPLRIDNNLLVELGLAGLPAHEKPGFLNHIYETLEMRVGMRLADQMSNEQLDEFETFYNAKDDAGAFKWLETNFPNYKDIVAEEFQKLKSEIGQQASQILAASQQAAAQQPQQPDQYTQQQPPAPQQFQQQPPQPPMPDTGQQYQNPPQQPPAGPPQQ